MFTSRPRVSQSTPLRMRGRQGRRFARPTTRLSGGTNCLRGHTQEKESRMRNDKLFIPWLFISSFCRGPIGYIVMRAGVTTLNRSIDNPTRGNDAIRSTNSSRIGIYGREEQREEQREVIMSFV